MKLFLATAPYDFARDLSEAYEDKPISEDWNGAWMLGALLLIGLWAVIKGFREGVRLRKRAQEKSRLGK